MHARHNNYQVFVTESASPEISSSLHTRTLNLITRRTNATRRISRNTLKPVQPCVLNRRHRHSTPARRGRGRARRVSCSADVHLCARKSALKTLHAVEAYPARLGATVPTSVHSLLDHSGARAPGLPGPHGRIRGGGRVDQHGLRKPSVFQGDARAVPWPADAYVTQQPA